MKLDLAELRKRWQARSLLALTLETDRIIASIVRNDAARAGAPPRKPVVIEVGADEIVRSPEKAAQSVALALSNAGWKERRCVVCVPPGWALSTATDLPVMSTEDLRGFLEIRAEQEFSLPAGDLRLGYCVYSLQHGRQRATLAVISSKRLTAIETFVQTMGRRLISLSLALEDALSDPQPTLHFQANGSHTDVIITGGGGAIAALRSLPSPVATEEAPFDAGAFCREVRITLGRLPTDLRRDVVQAQFGGSPDSAQRLCAAIRDDLQRMGIQSVDCDAPQRRRAERPAGGGSADGAAADAADRTLHGQPVPFEFVVPEINKWETALVRFDSKRHRWIAGAVLGLILLPLLLFFVRAQIESHLSSRWEGMRDNVKELDDVQQKIRQFRPWFEPAPITLKALESLISAFPEKGEVWAKSVQVSPGNKVTCTGTARSAAALQAMSDRLRAQPGVSGLQVPQTRGDKPALQFSITYTWQPPPQ